MDWREEILDKNTIRGIDLGVKVEEMKKEFRELKRKKGEINKDYVPNVKNPFMRYVRWFGGLSNVKRMAFSGESSNEPVKELYFKYMEYEDKLKEVENRISRLQNEYFGTISELNPSYFMEKIPEYFR